MPAEGDSRSLRGSFEPVASRWRSAWSPKTLSEAHSAIAAVDNLCGGRFPVAVDSTERVLPDKLYVIAATLGAFHCLLILHRSHQNPFLWVREMPGIVTFPAETNKAE